MLRQLAPDFFRVSDRAVRPSCRSAPVPLGLDFQLPAQFGDTLPQSSQSHPAATIRFEFTQLLRRNTAVTRADRRVSIAGLDPMPNRDHANNVSGPAARKSRVEPVRVGLFQIQRPIGTHRRRWSGALGTTKQQRMSKLFDRSQDNFSPFGAGSR